MTYRTSSRRTETVVIWPYNFQLDENDNNDDIQTSLNIH